MHTSIQERMLIKYLTFVTGPTYIWVIPDLLKVSKERIIFQMTLVEKKVDLRDNGVSKAPPSLRSSSPCAITRRNFNLVPLTNSKKWHAAKN